MHIPVRYSSPRGDKRRHFIPNNNNKSLLAMFGSTINLEEEITKENTKGLLVEEQHLEQQSKLDHEHAKITARVAEAYRDGLAAELGFDYNLAAARRIQQERQSFTMLPQNRIMSTDAIKAVCIKFGLRFLPTRFYRGALDDGIGPAVQSLREIMGGKLPVVTDAELLGGMAYGSPSTKPQFSIAAPQSAFNLQPRPQDPLLFLRLSSLKWYLVHKWGDDLKTADVRKGQINENNWNSPFGDDQAASAWDMQRAALSQMQNQIFTGATVNSILVGGSSNTFRIADHNSGIQFGAGIPVTWTGSTQGTQGWTAIS